MALPTDVHSLLEELILLATRMKARGETNQFVLAQSMANQLQGKADPLPKALLGNAQAVLRHFGRV